MMVVQCVRQIVPNGCPSEPARRLDLVVGKKYRVITVEGNDYRLLGESDGPYLYPAMAFTIIDDAWDDDWMGEEDAEEGTCIGPPSLLSPGLWEDYFDRDPMIRSMVDEVLRIKGVRN